MSHRWEIYCVNEGCFVFSDFVKSKPTSCPNDPGHQIAGATVVESKSAPTSMTIVFRNGTKPSVTYEGLVPGNYTEVTEFSFAGTSVLDTVQQVQILGHTTGTGTAIIRVIDSTTGLEVATGALPMNENVPVDLTLPEEWPTAPTSLSVQVKINEKATVVLKSLTIIMFN